MNSQNDSIVQLQNEIGQWEHAINSYNGSDPLELWFSYVCWLESNLSTYQGLESRFRKSVEHCLSIYDKYENYKQDLRMVKLWIKYIDFQPNPLNLYKILYQQGVGTKCAAFYIGWAHYYNSANHFKQAESIYNLGIQLKAEPLQELETAQKNFRFSVAQRMLYNDESSKKRTISSLEEQRQQITSLSPHQNQMTQMSAKRMRTDSYDQYGSSNGMNAQVQPQNNNVQPQQQQQQQQQPQYDQEYQTYSNDAGYAISSSLNYVYDNSNVYSNIEEQQQSEVPNNFTFECGFQMPQGFINFSRNSQEPWNGLLFLEEPYDVNRKCCYPKHQVYPGDGFEYSLEELKGRKWHLKVEEKRKHEELRIQEEKARQERLRQEQETMRLRQEQEALRLRQEQEALRLRQEQERIRQETEAKRLRDEQERIRKEQERIKAEQEAQRQRDEAERLRKQQEAYQMQQQQQQRWNYHNSPVNYGPNQYHHNYYHQNYSPQYSYVHDHQYQTHYTAYQHNSPQQNYAHSPNYHQQSVIVNRNQYETHHVHHQQQQQQHYYVNYQTQHSMQGYQMQPQPVQPQIIQPQPQVYQQLAQQSPTIGHQQNMQQQVQQQQQPLSQDYHDVEYLIDHQAEIDPQILQQPIVESSSQENSSQENSSLEENDYDDQESADDSYEDETDEQIPPIVTSYMLDDLEEQIEASTISFSSNGKSRDKKITIKFRKEKTTTIINSTSNSSSSKTGKEVPSETSSTSSSIKSSSQKKQPKKELVTSYDGENTQFMPSAANSCSSVVDNVKHSFSKITFNGCVTPVKKQGMSKSSTPISSYKYLKNQSSFVSNQNEDSICSFTGDQNSFFQAENDEDFKSNRMEKALATIDEHMKKRDIDPFNTELCRSFLVKMNFPNREEKGDYLVTNGNLPKLMKNQTVPIGDVSYQIEKEVGRGAYGAVYRGINLNDGQAVALKYQRPSNLATWELYICTEVKKRIKNADILPGFMTISAAVIAPNASVLISEFSQFGSLLDINNRIRLATTKVMHESLVMHFASQIFNIVAHLHDCKIIHADIKPDNFLLMTLPSADTHVPSLRLIDFGCAIDMTLFKEGQEFRKIIETDGFTCVEMQEGRHWSYHTDLFCIAGTIHVMLFGEYMQVNKKFGIWDIKQKFPRYLNKSLWTEIFSKLLNIKDSESLPNLRHMKAKVDREVNENELVKNIRTVSNLIRKR